MKTTPEAEQIHQGMVHAKVLYEIHVSDTPLIGVNSYSHKGHQFHPRKIAVTIDTGVYPFQEVVVVGPIPRKDGTLGERQGEARFRSRGYTAEETLEGMPDWLAELTAPYLAAPIFDGTTDSTALTAAALAFFAMEFEGVPHPPAEQVRAEFAAAVHAYRAAVA